MSSIRTETPRGKVPLWTFFPLLTRPVSVSALHRHHRLLSDAPVFQPSAIEFFSVAAARLWNTAAERLVGIVNICFQETFEDPSLQSFFLRVSCSAYAVTFSDTILDLFYLLTYLLTYLLNLFIYFHPFFLHRQVAKVFVIISTIIL